MLAGDGRGGAPEPEDDTGAGGGPCGAQAGGVRAPDADDGAPTRLLVAPTTSRAPRRELRREVCRPSSSSRRRRSSGGSAGLLCIVRIRELSNSRLDLADPDMYDDDGTMIGLSVSQKIHGDIAGDN